MTKVDFTSLLTPSQVAKELGVSPITVRSWVNKGWLTSHVTPGGHRRFSREEIKRLMLEKSMGSVHAEKVRILIVDDDTQFRGYLTEVIATFLPESDVEEAADGFEAGIRLAQFNPDLVFLDYAMPGTNGVEACKLIRSNPAYQSIRIVAVTGHALDEIEQDLISAGANQVIFKPVSLIALEKILKEVAVSRGIGDKAHQTGAY